MQSAAPQSEKQYLTCAETAKLVRAALKREFPGVKFSVRSQTYSGGASIDVKWTDGPTTKRVDPVVKAYAGGDFDGMIDLAYHVETWLLPDGSAAPAYSEGTEGSRGVHEGYAYAPPEGARLVSMGADYVFTERSYSKAFLEHMTVETCDYWGLEDRPTVIVSKWGSVTFADDGKATAYPPNAGGRDNVAQLVYRRAQETEQTAVAS